MNALGFLANVIKHHEDHDNRVIKLSLIVVPFKTPVLEPGNKGKVK